MKSWSRHLGLETVSRPDFDCLALISVSGESGKVSSRSQLDQNFKRLYRGYRGGSPTAVRPSDPALCGSCPLVTPYYCRLGDLLCFMCVYRFVCALLSLHLCFVLFPLFDLSFVDLPSVLWYCWLGPLTCKNRLPYNLYCVGGDVKHCTIQLRHLEKRLGLGLKRSRSRLEDQKVVLRPHWSRSFSVSKEKVSFTSLDIKQQNIYVLDCAIIQCVKMQQDIYSLFNNIL